MHHYSKKNERIIEPKISILPLFVFFNKGIYMLKTILQISMERRKGLKEGQSLTIN